MVRNNLETIDINLEATNKNSDSSLNSNQEESLDTSDLINKVISGYKITKLMKKSTESFVFNAKNKEEDYVLKLYFKNRTIDQAASKKIRNLTKSNIMKSVDIGKYQGRFFEVFKYYKNGTLLDKINTLSITNIKRIIIQVNEALKSLHEIEIIHGDVKPSNLYFDDDYKTILLGDFGNSIMADGRRYVSNTSRRITPEYAAPEAYEKLSYKTDYFSFGMTLLHLVSSDYFEGRRDSSTLRDLILQDEIVIDSNVDDSIADLISSLIRSSPRLRSNYSSVYKWTKNHLFLNGNRFERTTETKTSIEPTIFLETSYNELEKLILALNSNWEDGIEFIKSESFEELIITFDKELRKELKKIIEENKKDPDLTLYFVSKKLYPRISIFWKGINYGKDMFSIVRSLLENYSKLDQTFIDLDIFKNVISSAYSGEQAFKKINIINKIFDVFGDNKIICADLIINFFSLLGKESNFYFEGKNYKNITEFGYRLFNSSGKVNRESKNILKLIESNLLIDLFEELSINMNANSKLEREKIELKERINKIRTEKDIFLKTALLSKLVNGEHPVIKVGTNTFKGTNSFFDFADQQYLSKRNYQEMEDDFLTNFVLDGRLRKYAIADGILDNELDNLIKLIEKQGMPRLNRAETIPMVALMYFSRPKKEYLFYFENNIFKNISQLEAYLKRGTNPDPQSLEKLLKNPLYSLFKSKFK